MTGIKQVPDGTSRKTIDDIHAQSARGLGSIDYFVGCAFAHALGLSVAPDILGGVSLVIGINKSKVSGAVNRVCEETSTTIG